MILRFSVDGETDNKLGLKLRAVLKKHKVLLEGKTGTYEKYFATKRLSDCIEDFWSTASEYEGPGHVDHFWMYADKSKKVSSPKRTKVKPRKRVPK